MNSTAQAALEYLMTYGWALVLIATVVAVLVFIVSSSSSVVFSSSDPTKILMKGGSLLGSDAEIKMQNITGGSIDVTSVSMTSNYSGAGCSLNSVPLGSGGRFLPAASFILSAVMWLAMAPAPSTSITLILPVCREA